MYTKMLSPVSFAVICTMAYCFLSLFLSAQDTIPDCETRIFLEVISFFRIPPVIRKVDFFDGSSLTVSEP
jgi:hypothetical protein